MKAVLVPRERHDSWGDSCRRSVARNAGGALAADAIQLETKNVYVWFKVPDTSLDVTVGLQSQSDHYAGIFYGGADMAGIFVEREVRAGEVDPRLGEAV